jgi:hypothetical protein
MIDLLTKPEGLVTVTDAADKDHQLPSMLQLITDVTGLTDDLSGAVTQVREISSQTLALSNDARASANAAAASAADAKASEASLSKAVGDAAASAIDAAASAVHAAASELAAKKSADAASASQGATATSEANAQGYMNTAGTSAEAARTFRDDAQLARDMSSSYANAPVNSEVSPGKYSAFHWAEQARLVAVGAVVYKGSWDATGNTMPSTPKLGDFYFISKAGTVNGVKWASGDMAVFDGTLWERIDNQQAVTTVAGRTGAVVLTVADVANLQAALDAKMGAGGGTFTGGITVRTAPSTGTVGLVPGAGLPEGMPGYVQFSGADGLRRGYIGWGNTAGTEVQIQSENGAHFNFTGNEPTILGKQVWHAGNFDPATKQNALSWNPVQQGTGIGQATNAVKIGYAAGGTGKTKLTIDSTDFGALALENWVQSNFVQLNGSSNISGSIVFQAQSAERQVQWAFAGRTAYIYGSPNGDMGLYDTAGGSRWRTDTGNNFFVGANMTAGGTVQGNIVTTNGAGGAYLGGNGTGLQWNGAMYLNGTGYYLNASANGWIRMPRMFVQGNDPGGTAYDGDLWIW